MKEIMGNKLTSIPSNRKNRDILTSKRKAKFNILIGEKLEKGYDFKNVQKKESHCLGLFFEKTIGKDWDYVISNYERQQDKNDIVDGHEILHFEISQKGRIHGYLENGIFVMIRFDPNHHVHK